MELRELRAFVAAGRELHFARAAALLFMSPSAMSELIRRLEHELGTPLFERTTRRIRLTEAGAELLARAETILELTAQAAEAVAAIGQGQSGAVRLGVTPPAAPVLAPHLAARFAAVAPGSPVEIERMWLPAVGAALQAGTIDVALTCGDLGVAGASVTTVEIGAEPLLIGLRPVMGWPGSPRSTWAPSAAGHSDCTRPTSSRPGMRCSAGSSTRPGSTRRSSSSTTATSRPGTGPVRQRSSGSC